MHMHTIFDIYITFTLCNAVCMRCDEYTKRCIENEYEIQKLHTALPSSYSMHNRKTKYERKIRYLTNKYMLCRWFYNLSERPSPSQLNPSLTK